MNATPTTRPPSTRLPDEAPFDIDETFGAEPDVSFDVADFDEVRLADRMHAAALAGRHFSEGR